MFFFPFLILEMAEASQQPSSQNTTLVGKHLHETLCTIETLYELGQFQGSARRVFELIERCSPHRPVSIVLENKNRKKGCIFAILTLFCIP